MGQLLPSLLRRAPRQILGQVSIGLFPPGYLCADHPSQSSDGQEQGDRAQRRAARQSEIPTLFTVQLIWAARGESATGAIRLSLLGWSREEIAVAAAEGPPRCRAEQLRRCLGRLEQRLRRLSPRADKLPREREQRARLISRLRADLLRILNPRTGRTHHAEQRHRSMERPTSLALRDAREVGDERLYRDLHEETVIVIGPKLRAHVFSSDGLHVTSLRLEPQELQRRRKKRRWAPLLGTELASFRAAIKEREKRDEAQTADTSKGEGARSPKSRRNRGSKGKS